MCITLYIKKACFHFLQRQLKYKVATSLDSKKYFLQYQKYHHSLFEPEKLINSETNGSDNNSQSTNNNSIVAASSTCNTIAPNSENSNPNENQNINAMALTRHQSEPNEDAEDAEEEEPVPIPDNQTLLRLLEYDEKVLDFIISIGRWWNFFFINFAFKYINE